MPDPALGAAEHPEEAPHLGQRLPAGGGDDPESLDRRFGMLVRGIARAIRLDDHHGQAVGDHIVQLPRDPMALGERLHLRVRCSLAFLLDRPLALELGPLASRADLVTERPDQDQQGEARHEHGPLRRRQERQRVRQQSRRSNRPVAPAQNRTYAATRARIATRANVRPPYAATENSEAGSAMFQNASGSPIASCASVATAMIVKDARGNVRRMARPPA